jgi:hypothetical protein
LKAVKDIGVDYFFVDKLNLRYGVWPDLLKMLKEHYPALIPEYRKIFFKPGAKDVYVQGLSAMVNELASRMGADSKMRLCL